MSVPVRFFRAPQTIALLVLVLGAGLLVRGKAAAVHDKRAVPLPTEIGVWKGEVRAVDQRTYEILETEDVSVVEYKSPLGPPVMLTRVAGFGDRATFHPPEICFVGSHFRIEEREPITVQINGQDHSFMRLVVARDGTRYLNWYWLRRRIFRPA